MDKPFLENCRCYTCGNFPAAYLHHLFNTSELLAYRLATIHNLTFMQDLMVEIREAIMNGTYDSFAANFRRNYRTTEEEIRLSQKTKWLKTRRTNNEVNSKTNNP